MCTGICTPYYCGEEYVWGKQGTQVVCEFVRRKSTCGGWQGRQWGEEMEFTRGKSAWGGSVGLGCSRGCKRGVVMWPWVLQGCKRVAVV